MSDNAQPSNAPKPVNFEQLFAKKYFEATPDVRQEFRTLLFSDAVADYKSRVHRAFSPSTQHVQITEVVNSAIYRALVMYANSPENIEKIENFLAYLYRVAKTALLRQLSRNGKTISLSDPNDDEAPTSNVPAPAESSYNTFIEDLEKESVSLQEVLGDYPRLCDPQNERDQLDQKIVLLAGEGYTNLQIADKLNKSYNVVTHRRKEICAYMLRCRIQAARRDGCSAQTVIRDLQLSELRYISSSIMRALDATPREFEAAFRELAKTKPEFARLVEDDQFAEKIDQLTKSESSDR